MKVSHRMLFLAGALIIGSYYLALVWPGLGVYFCSDDTMNLYVPWSHSALALILANLVFFRAWPIYRPLGAAWYAAIFHFSGFHSLPFHAVHTALLLINIFLTYSLSRRLAGSREIAAVAALFASYHPAFALLYFDTGYVYDALCYFFYFAAVLLYVRVRQENRLPTTRELAACCLLYICALNSKEMAVTLPVTLLIYELVYHPPSSWRGVRMVLRSPAILLTGAITLLFVVGKSFGPESLLRIDAYRPVFTVTRFLETSRHFVKETLFYATNTRLLALWAALLLIAWISRLRVLQFAWLFLMLAPLPVAFIQPRGAAQYYLPWFGWVLYGSAALIEALRRITRLLLPKLSPPWNGSRVRGSMVLPLLALILLPLYKHKGWANAAPVSVEAPLIREAVAQLHALHPRFSRGSRLLFKNDPFQPDHWELVFLVKESYGDDSLEVYRSKQQGHPASDTESYDYIFDYRRGRFVELEASASSARR
jgi:hypothetical protein